MYGNNVCMADSHALSIQEFQEYLFQEYPECHLYRDPSRIWRAHGLCGRDLKTAFEEFVSTCNFDRDTPEGYEVCYDLECGNTKLTLYAMCENGDVLLELPVQLNDNDSSL